MEPSAGKRLAGGGLVLQIALHHDVAAKDHLAHGGGITRHLQAGLRIDHGAGLLHLIAHALAGVEIGLLADRQRLPFLVLGAGRRRPVDLGQPIHMGHIETHLRHAFDHCGRRRRAGHHRLDLPVDALAQGSRCGDQRGMHDRCATVMRHMVLTHQAEDQRRINPTQTDIGAGHGRERPRETPAIAVKHRQCPEIDRMARQVPGEHIADRVQIGAAVMDHHTLGVAGGARGVVQADRIPFIFRQPPDMGRVAARNQVLVGNVTEAHARAAVFRVIDIDQHRQAFAGRLHQPDGGPHHLGELAIDNQHLAVGMLEHEGHRGCVEPGIDAVKHRARHRHAVMRFDHRRGVGQHDRHRVAFANLHGRQARGQPHRTFAQLHPGPAQRPMHDRAAIGIDISRPADERQGRQRHMVGGVAIESLTIGIGMGGHGRLLLIDGLSADPAIETMLRIRR